MHLILAPRGPLIAARAVWDARSSALIVPPLTEFRQGVKLTICNLIATETSKGLRVSRTSYSLKDLRIVPTSSEASVIKLAFVSTRIRPLSRISRPIQSSDSWVGSARS